MQVVELSALKQLLRAHPAAQVNGRSLIGYFRCDVDTNQTRTHGPDSNHFPLKECPAGQLLIIRLSNTPLTSPSELYERLLNEPDDLLLGVQLPLQLSLSDFRLARKASVALSPEPCIELKVFERLGKITLYADEVPRLLELNDTNREWWLREQLKGVRNHDAARQVWNKAKERWPDLVLYALHSPSLGWYVFMSETTLRAYLPKLPKLPKELQLLVGGSSEGIQEFEAPCDTLFALFGSGESFIKHLADLA